MAAVRDLETHREGAAIETEGRSGAGPIAPAPAREEVRFARGAMIGRYEIIGPLGRGGMGEVCLARDTRLGRLCAIKLLTRVDAVASARFVTEAWATAQINHENIVTLYELATHEGLPYMVLEHVK